VPTAGELPGIGVKVGVIDSGLWHHPWLGHRVTGRSKDLEASDEGVPVDADGTTLRYFAGHGTFIAGIVLQHAPGAAIVARRVVSNEMVDDVKLGRQLIEMGGLVAVVNLSLSTRVHHEDDPDDRLGMMITANALIDMARRRPDPVVVAPAGNDGGVEPVWPAAFDSVVSVAALDADGDDSAFFTNHGDWVDASAPGVDVHSTFVHWSGGVEVHPGHQVARAPGGDLAFEGWARWSGTSFAAPRVAGAIAALVTPHLNARQAATMLLQDSGLDHRRGYGSILPPEAYT
jgi:subtilisin family serine protease